MTPRAYDTTGRQASAQARHAHVLATAATAFARDGWHGTTVRAVAEQAGVSPELVYRSLGGKTGLLLGAVRYAGFGPGTDLRTAVADLHLADLPDQRSRLEALSGLAVRALGGLAPLAGVLAVAADSDADAAAMLLEVQQQRRATAHGLVALLVGDAGPPAARRAAGDEVYVLTSVLTYLQFVQELGWPVGDYAGWLVDSTADVLRRHGLATASLDP